MADNMDELETITLTFEDGEEVEFFVLEETTLMGNNYFLVVEASEQEDEECYILKESKDTDEEGFGMYDFVEDEKELESLFPIFKELLEDSDTEVEF